MDWSWMTDWLPRPGEASPTLQLAFLTMFALVILAIVVLIIYVLTIRRVARELQGQVSALEAGRRQNAERLDGLTTAVERLAKHHHIGASMGHEPFVADDQPVIVEASVDNSIPWVNPVPLLHDNPDLLRDSDLPLERFADPAPITDPNMRVQGPISGSGRALPPVPPDPRRLRQFVAPARNITSEPITAVDAPAIVLPDDEPQPRLPRHAAPDTAGRHAAH